MRARELPVEKRAPPLVWGGEGGQGREGGKGREKREGRGERGGGELVGVVR